MSDNILAAFGATALDNIEVVPGFRVPPSGTYQVEAECELKVINNKPCFSLKLKLDQEDEEPVDGKARFLKGDQFGAMFMDKDGLEKGRETVAQIMEAFSSTTLQGCVDAGTISATVTMVRTVDKEDPDKAYCRVKKIAAN